MLVTIPKRTDLHKISSILSENHSVTEITIHQSLNANFGYTSEVIQMVVSLCKTNSEIITKINNDLDSDEKIINLLNNPILLSSILMSKDINCVKKQDLKKKDISRHIIFKLDNHVFIKRSAHFFIVDHSKDRFRFPPLMYKDTEDGATIRSPNELSILIKQYINDLVKEESISKPWINHISIFFHELMKNTHEHALPSWENHRETRSIRGCIFKFTKINKDDSIEKIADQGTPEFKYLKKIISQFDTILTHKFIEISFFDSGNGLFKTNNNIDNYNITIQEEYIKTIDCFKKHISSKSNKFKFGLGLYASLEAIKAISGYIKIRTGRLSLITSFSIGNEDSDICNLIDSINFDNTPTELPAVYGVSYTIIIPIVK